LFKQVRIKTLEIDGLPVTVQFNPSRIVSSGTKTDALSIRERKCFLCFENCPAEQAYVPFGEDYLILCNPFPVFPQHFTVPARQHVEQSIGGCLEDMFDLAEALDSYTVFYNGARSGASAPDHMHFQITARNKRQAVPVG
jgi:ATP adenylyltransferase/5',5'''-P-1,P-4-tetraphosphate phosphorylase II